MYMRAGSALGLYWLITRRLLYIQVMHSYCCLLDTCRVALLPGKQALAGACLSEVVRVCDAAMYPILYACLAFPALRT